jgi:hypothetical protein
LQSSRKFTGETSAFNFETKMVSSFACDASAQGTDGDKQYRILAIDTSDSTVACKVAIAKQFFAASHEWRTGIEQVNQAVSQLDQVTQQKAARHRLVAALIHTIEKDNSFSFNLISSHSILPFTMSR